MKAAPVAASDTQTIALVRIVQVLNGLGYTPYGSTDGIANVLAYIARRFGCASKLARILKGEDL